MMPPGWQGAAGPLKRTRAAATGAGPVSEEGEAEEEEEGEDEEEDEEEQEEEEEGVYEHDKVVVEEDTTGVMRWWRKRGQGNMNKMRRRIRRMRKG